MANVSTVLYPASSATQERALEAKRGESVYKLIVNHS
jgi:hypothetical protein